MPHHELPYFLGVRGDRRGQPNQDDPWRRHFRAFRWFHWFRVDHEDLVVLAFRVVRGHLFLCARFDRAVTSVFDFLCSCPWESVRMDMDQFGLFLII